MASIPQQFTEAQRLSMRVQSYAPEAHIQGRQQTVGVKQFCEEYLAEQADVGQVLTPVMRMPDATRGPVLEYMTNDGPWVHTGPRLLVTLKNTGRSPVGVVTHTDDHDYVDHRGMSADRYMREVFEQEVKPGETIELDAVRAVQALHRYCRTAMEPRGQQTWPHNHDVLVEIGFRGVLNGKPIEGSVPATKSRK